MGKSLIYSELKDKDEQSTLSPIDSKPDNTSPCQTPRECQTRSTATLKKPSMNKHTQQISATTSLCAQRSTQQLSATTEPDLPQFGSEDDDETWLTELIGSETTGPREAANQAYIQAWGIFWHRNDTLHQNLKSQSEVDPVLPRITVPVVTTLSAAPCSTIGHGCDLPGPQSQDDDEDSSPIVQELDRAEHTQCSSNNHSN